MRQISGWHEVHKRDCNFSSKFLRDVYEKIYGKYPRNEAVFSFKCGDWDITFGCISELTLRKYDEWNNRIQEFQLSAKDLENLFVDCLNPTPEECTLFELEYGFKWLFDPTQRAIEKHYDFK